jgi:hypothetical protein
METMMSDAYEPFNIVCTNKGQHPRIKLTKIRFRDDGTLYDWRVSDSFHPADGGNWEKLWTRADGQPNQVFVVNCPRCRRNTELTPDKWRVLFVGLVAKGVTRLDISALPF